MSGLKAKDQKEIKGIYFDRNIGKVYFVNKIQGNQIFVSTVKTNVNQGMMKVLDDQKVISLIDFKEFEFSGNYTREEINNQ